jgi:FkbM family methyltransferase
MNDVVLSLLKCFNKHSFNELNNGDYNVLHEALGFFLSKYPTKVSGIFFDVGCNAGSFVKALSSFNITTGIHCFEPHPVLAQKVKEVYPYVIMETLCLGNTNSDITINIPELSVGLSSLIYRPVFDQLGQTIIKFPTKCKTLDQYCKENNIQSINFLKIDVEGAEKMIIEGAHEMLNTHSIIAGMFEVGQTLIDAGTNAQEIKLILEKYGYKVIPTSSGNDYIFYLEPV